MTALPHDHTHDHAHPAPAAPSSPDTGDRKVDLKIIAVLFGCTVLITAVVARFLFDTPDYSNLLAMAAAILLGWPIVYGAAKSLITGRCSHDHGEACDHDHDHVRSDSHMEELVALAIIASFASGEYLECAAVAFFMLIASLIEHRTAVGALKSIESLIRITPTRAVKLADDGSESEVHAATLVPGDKVVVLPGDNIPGDGQIKEGVSTVDEANITGESLPVEKSPGDEVFGGTINETGRMVIEITRAGEDSTLGKVQGLILQAAQTRPAAVRELSKYAAFYTPVVVMLAGIIYFFSKDLSNSISLLLIACPCAIILAAPTAVVAALSSAARLGVYVKSVAELEVVRRVTAFVFDKTGTITTGQLAVTRMKPIDGMEAADLLRYAVSVEENSRHPVARAVVAIASKAKIQAGNTDNVEEVAGRGMKATVDGRAVMVGRQTWLQEQGVDLSAADISEGEGLSLLFVAVDNQYAGWLGMADQPREQAAAAIAELGELGVKRRVMITGDRQSPAARVAAAVGITDYSAEALPGDKLTLVEDLKKAGHTVAVLGDGVNDGPALAAGHVSIAMGAAGSDVAVNSARIALMNNNLDRLPFLVMLSRRTVAIIRQNLIATMIYILFMLALLAAGVLTPMWAAIGHGISSILIIFNSARLVRVGEDLEHHDDVVAKTETARPVQTTRVEPAPPVATA
ncbi:heavy metal translocating P-type ATPase [Algisphaera agarilytica]|uniref:P-type Zn(2+) transporter n=1 Tax=Algisphaera agarilytica TaxID=1385975 RepID=A0A7X0LM47_9BACT|nr:cation-translocating P-type ATPase [Algisphaera agarilytica]MBB6431687.1 Cd2+/Zn2+-exporting ATPase [Algisphaera agarilytica]